MMISSDDQKRIDAAKVDDYCAFRLAVKLRLDISHESGDAGMQVSINGRQVIVPYGNDPYAATRMAIALGAEKRLKSSTGSATCLSK